MSEVEKGNKKRKIESSEDEDKNIEANEFCYQSYTKRLDIDKQILRLKKEQDKLFLLFQKDYPFLKRKPLERIIEEEDIWADNITVSKEENIRMFGSSIDKASNSTRNDYHEDHLKENNNSILNFLSKIRKNTRFRKVGTVNGPQFHNSNGFYINKHIIDEESSSRSSTPGSTKALITDKITLEDETIKKLPQANMNKNRDTKKPKSKLLKNFSCTSILTPALILNPAIQGYDEFSRKFATGNFGEDLCLQLAAAHINDAMDGKGRFGKAHAFFKPKRLKNAYKILSSKIWWLLVYFTIALHCIIMGWEQPFTPCQIGEKWTTNRSYYSAVIVLNAICLAIYVTDICLHTVFLSWYHLWNAKEAFWLRLEFILTVLYAIDFIVLIIQVFLEVRLLCPFRGLRAAMLLCKSKNVSHIFDVLVSITSKLGKVFFIIITFIVMFACIGVHLYSQHYQNLTNPCYNGSSRAFNNLASATMHMFVLMSTENYPEFMIPAYTRNWTNFFYFGIYLYAGVFFLTAILLAIIVESYWDYSKLYVKQERKQQREQLAKAWNLLDPLGKGEIPVNAPSLYKLFKIIMPKVKKAILSYLVTCFDIEQNTEIENEALIKYISLQGNNSSTNSDVVVAYDWTTKLIDALSFEFGKEKNFRRYSDAFSGKIRRKLRFIINHDRFAVGILNLILIHSVLFCLMWDGITDNTQLIIQSIRTFIICLFLVELILRLLVEGKALLNVYDLVDLTMIISATVASFTWYILWFQEIRPAPVYLGACVVVSSICVVIRTFFISLHARRAISVLRSIYPVMFDLILLVVIIVFFYAVLGFELFQEKDLTESKIRQYEGSYIEYECETGFATFGCSVLVVFQIVVTNDWHEIMLGAQLDAGWQSVFYFITCYLIINMIVINLFVAISIEAYKKLARFDRNFNQQIINQEDPQIKAPKVSTTETENSAMNIAKHQLNQIFAISSRRSSTSWHDIIQTTNDPTMTSPELKRLNMRRKSLMESLQHLSTETSKISSSNIDHNRIQEKLLERKHQMKKRVKMRKQSRRKTSNSSVSSVSRDFSKESSKTVGFELHPVNPGSTKTHRTNIRGMRKRNDGIGWRRDIHGDMTVMNRDEWKHLNQMFRGGLERPANDKPRKFGVVDVMRRGSFNLGLFSALNKIDQERNPKSSAENPKSKNNTAGSSSPNKESPGPSVEDPFPAWMQKFVDEKKLLVRGDMKIQEV